MTPAHFTIRHTRGRWVAYCTTHCHHPIGAWTAADLETKIRSL